MHLKQSPNTIVFVADVFTQFHRSDHVLQETDVLITARVILDVSEDIDPMSSILIKSDLCLALLQLPERCLHTAKGRGLILLEISAAAGC